MPITEHFSLRTAPLEGVQMIISVPKKIYKKAVLRNKIRRRIRPILREFRPLLKPSKYILVVKSGAEDLKGESLKKELAQAFKIS